jgi:DNA-binding beta-propeller fold protein YncE
LNALLRFSAIFSGVVLLALVSGCAAVRSPEPVWTDSNVDLVWPEPPATPRLRYLRTLTGPADFREQGQGGRLFRWLTGEKEQGLPLLNPYGVAADGGGRVWVADFGVRAVHAFDLSRRRVDYITSAGKEPFLSPVGVAYDAASGRLYVSDSALGKVFAFDDAGNLLRTVEPPGGYGRPAGLTTDASGKLYVADVLKGRIEVFSAAGDHLRSLGRAGTAAGEFNRPTNVSVDGAGRIFVTDSMNFRIGVLGPDGEPLATIGEIGDVPGTFARPRGVAVDSEGHVYVADAAFDNVQIFDRTGQLLLYFGDMGDGAGSFNLPAGLFIDRKDRLYVVDTFNHRVQIFQYLRGGEGGR